MTQTRENISTDLKRIDLLTSTDIRNVKKSYEIDIQDGCHHKDDATSDNNPVLYYKTQGQENPKLANDDFYLIIVNAIQKDVAKSFASKVIAIGGTTDTQETEGIKIASSVNNNSNALQEQLIANIFNLMQMATAGNLSDEQMKLMIEHTNAGLAIAKVAQKFECKLETEEEM